MEDLRGPNIQIVLHIKEGIGFNFLSSHLFVTGSLNGFTLETDPIPPCHTPRFDSDLVWETDKRRFRSLRIQNVPLKVEVYSVSSQGKNNKVGYLLLNLLGAQPYKANGTQNSKHTWHKLLGVKVDGKCCRPRLLLGLTVEDWTNTPTPRIELPISNAKEKCLPDMFGPSVRIEPFALEDYENEMNKKVTSPDLSPQLLTEEGLIHIGKPENRQIFELALVVRVVENFDVMVPESLPSVNCAVVYSVFSHNIETESFPTTKDGIKNTSVQFNQRTSLKLCTDLSSLSKYFAECPYVVTRLHTGDKCVGVCSTNLRKLIPTEDINTFLSSFCNTDQAFAIGERCFLLPCLDGVSVNGNRKPYIEIEISLAYIGMYKADTEWVKPEKPPSILDLERKKNISISVVGHGGKVLQAQMEKQSNPKPQTPIVSQEVVDMIRKMYESFTVSQERRIFDARPPPKTADNVVQPSDENSQTEVVNEKSKGNSVESKKVYDISDNSSQIKQKSDESTSTLIKTRHKAVIVEIDGDDTRSKTPDRVISREPFSDICDEDRQRILKKCYDELEDWKMEQQQMFKHELKQKEQHHLDVLAEEWNKRESDLESRLNKGIEQCRNMAAELSRSAEEFRQRSFNVAQREEKLLKAKKTIEQHYARKLLSLREASVKMADDAEHRLKLRDMRIEELEAMVKRLIRENCSFKKSEKLLEMERERGLTKEQASGLVHELRNLENQLQEAEESKEFFKDQWSKAVRDAQAARLLDRRQIMTHTQQTNRRADIRLDGDIEIAEPSKSNDLFHKLVREEPMLHDVCSDLIEGIDSHRKSARSTRSKS